jgi:type I restriction enzyme S subunit
MSKIRQLPVPIAPIAEQRRIVKRIDELFSEIAEGETELNHARADLDTWRRALLKAAVTGELTREWRETTRSNEDAYSVLSSIRGARIGLGSNRPTEMKPGLHNAEPQLPPGWAWTTLGEISASVRNGTSQAPRSEKNPHEILRISAVRPMRIDVSQIRFLSDKQAHSASDSVVERGDLLFTRYNGSADLVGVAAIYDDAPRFYPDKLIRVRLRTELTEVSRYIEAAVNTWVGRSHIARHIKTTAGQQGISGESLKQTPIPLPPPSEAIEIIAMLGRQQGDVEIEFGPMSKQASALRQSILKAAFAGELVAQDPSDETAEMMLEKLTSQGLDNSKPLRRSARAAQ